KLLLAIKSPELLQVHVDPLTLQHHMYPPIAEAAALGRHLPHRFPQVGIVRSDGSVAHARAIHPKHFTRPPLAHTVFLTGMRHSLPLRAGRHHFFAATSFRMALSSI